MGISVPTVNDKKPLVQTHLPLMCAISPKAQLRGESHGSRCQRPVRRSGREDHPVRRGAARHRIRARIGNRIRETASVISELTSRRASLEGLAAIARSQAKSFSMQSLCVNPPRDQRSSEQTQCRLSRISPPRQISQSAPNAVLGKFPSWSFLLQLTVPPGILMPRHTDKGFPCTGSISPQRVSGSPGIPLPSKRR